MNLKSFTLTSLALAALASLSQAFNQDHYFLYKTVTQSGAGPLAVGPDDKVYVSDTSGVSIYDPNLNLLSRIANVNARDVAVSDDGVIYVADGNAKKVKKYDLSGNAIGELCTLTVVPEECDINKETGNIYIRCSSVIKLFAPDGSFIKEINALSGRYAIINSGLLCFFDGSIYNESGIKINDLFTNGYSDISSMNGNYFCCNSYYDYVLNGWANIGYFHIYNKNMGLIYQNGYEYSRTQFRYGSLNHQGDICSVGSLNNANIISMFRRCEANSMGPEVRNAAPTSEITSIQQRPNSTLLDIDYKVTDLDNPKVHVAAAAFKNDTNDLNNMILLKTLVEETDKNLGTEISTGATHRLTWDARTDWGVDFGDVSVHIFARDDRPLLMGLHFLSLPASGTIPAMQITRSPVNQSAFLEPLMWLAASNSPAVSFANGQIKGVGGNFNDQLLASGTTVTQAGRQLVESLMGVREATTAEVQSAREASTPGNVNQWDLTNSDTQRIDRTYPLKVNEYGFDTGTYDATQWFWLVKTN